MKKSRIYMFLAALALPLMGCGSLGGPDAYGAVHIYGFSKKGCDVEIKGWRDAGGRGIEVDTEKYGPMLLSEGTYILLRDISQCPVCW